VHHALLPVRDQRLRSLRQLPVIVWIGSRDSRIDQCLRPGRKKALLPAPTWHDDPILALEFAIAAKALASCCQ
jgi:hypothetical protein